MTTRMAVLIDGDNIGGKHVAEILRIAGQAALPHVQRVYLDAQRPSDWHDVTGFRLVHAGSGKNGADILLCIDAIALALREQINNFVLVSSDRDFSHVALRLREFGATVTGIGEGKAPAAFRHACQTFFQVGPTPGMSLVPKPTINLTEFDLQIRAVIAEFSEKGTGIQIAKLGSTLHTRHKTHISTYPERTWRAYLVARPGLYDLDPRGPLARVRFIPQGFADAPAFAWQNHAQPGVTLASTA